MLSIIPAYFIMEKYLCREMVLAIQKGWSAQVE